MIISKKTINFPRFQGGWVPTFSREGVGVGVGAIAYSYRTI